MKNLTFILERKSPRQTPSTSEALEIERFLAKLKKAEFEGLGKKKSRQLKNEIWAIYSQL